MMIILSDVDRMTEKFEEIKISTFYLLDYLQENNYKMFLSL